MKFVIIEMGTPLAVSLLVLSCVFGVLSEDSTNTMATTTTSSTATVAEESTMATNATTKPDLANVTEKIELTDEKEPSLHAVKVEMASVNVSMDSGKTETKRQASLGSLKERFVKYPSQQSSTTATTMHPNVRTTRAAMPDNEHGGTRCTAGDLECLVTPCLAHDKTSAGKSSNFDLKVHNVNNLKLIDTKELLNMVKEMLRLHDEDEQVVDHLSDVLRNVTVSACHRANDKASLHHQPIPLLYVTGLLAVYNL